MRNNLLYEFEEDLNMEAKRIITELISMYNKRIVVNKPFGEVIKELAKKEYEYYCVDIELRVYKFLPTDYYPDPDNEYTLINSFEMTENHLIKYSNYCIKLNHKNHSKAAKQMVDILIDFSNKNPLTDISFAEVIANNMNKLFPEHNDSVDSRAMILYLQAEIEDKGYKIISLNPFRMIKNI